MFKQIERFSMTDAFNKTHDKHQIVITGELDNIVALIENIVHEKTFITTKYANQVLFEHNGIRQVWNTPQDLDITLFSTEFMVLSKDRDFEEKLVELSEQYDLCIEHMVLYSLENDLFGRMNTITRGQLRASMDLVTKRREILFDNIDSQIHAF